MATSRPNTAPSRPNTAPSRPNPALWLWYVYGGRLPGRYAGWVRRDTTGRHWLARHVVRIFVQALPVLLAGFLLLFLLTPFPWWAALLAMCFGLVLSMWLTVGMGPEMNRVRLAKHGLPPESGPRFKFERNG